MVTLAPQTFISGFQIIKDVAVAPSEMYMAYLTMRIGPNLKHFTKRNGDGGDGSH